jgi:nucleotide-binding universal stress UspA family protein
MKKTLLAATDFSKAALNAINYSVDMAVAINADLLLLHVFEIPVVYLEVPMAMPEQEIRNNAQAKMDNLLKRLHVRSKGKLNITSEIRTGDFFQEMKTVCERIKPYAVIMGSQGTTATARLLFGGHTIHAMKRLEWPVITVPFYASFKYIRNIGFACDFDDVVEYVPIEEIRLLVKDFNAKLHVLNTGNKDVLEPELVYESGLLQEMVVDLNPAYHFITNENVDEGIMDFAEKHQIDLLVIVPKRHSLLHNLVYKSHTREFVLHSQIPVLSIHQTT